VALVTDVVEVSYTGDLLAHRRCARAWAYEKRAGFQPYEVVQAMEGRLVHHAMEWLTRQYQEALDRRRHVTDEELRRQLDRHFKVLWARGIRTTFESKQATLDRVVANLFPGGQIDLVVKAVVEGAVHTEYELRAVKKVLPADAAEFAGKSRILLTGILDLVVQKLEPLTYDRIWAWDSVEALEGHPEERSLAAAPGEVEIWDYKATRAGSPFCTDYVRQLLTYAALYRDRTGELPARCVLFFINEPPDRSRRLLAIDVSEAIVDAALDWTYQQVRLLRATDAAFQDDPGGVEGGELGRRGEPAGRRLTAETKQQCTACSFRFDCAEYTANLDGGASHPDVDLTSVFKN
jgi:DNA helicase II / ATP-dependent DNA helicase PcrA